MTTPPLRLRIGHTTIQESPNGLTIPIGGGHGGKAEKDRRQHRRIAQGEGPDPGTAGKPFRGIRPGGKQMGDRSLLAFGRYHGLLDLEMDMQYRNISELQSELTIDPLTLQGQFVRNENGTDVFRYTTEILLDN